MIKVPRPLVRELRAKLRDYPEWNYLEKNEENKDQQLARILYEALEMFNLYPPILDMWDFTNLPRGTTRLIINIALVIVLKEVSIWMARNEFQYQSGNTSVKLYDKWRSYQALIPGLDQDGRQLAEQYKVKLNIDGAWGENITEMYDTSFWTDPQNYITVEV